MSDYIDILFDGPPSHESGRFVEVEDSAGRSIRCGEWIHRGEGYWVLRIDSPRALRAEVERLTLERDRLYEREGKLAAQVERLEKARELVAQQANDRGLWFLSLTAPEAYLQQELRRLHAVIEEQSDE